MGMEYRKRFYQITLITGEKKVVFCSRIELKGIIKESKVRGYKIL